MKTSWTDQQLIEDYLSSRLSETEIIGFQYRLKSDETFSEQLKWQQRTMYFVRQYGRQELKKDLDIIHHHLFSDPIHSSFKQKILRFFNS
ncbi:MAG: hypothetical protein IPI60_15895 [Saprospiraceae bacterium]|nr:hypothetical protein [Saprospiraceae bacterium]